MIVPIDLLKPVLDDLRSFGRVNKPARPWLGMYTTEIDNRVVVIGIASNGPAARAELKAGDVILAVDGDKITSQTGFYRKLWSLGRRRRRRAAHCPPRRRHLRRDAGFDRSRQAVEGAAAPLSRQRTGSSAMSEAVVDDIVAVLPPLLQSLEALGFVARYLNPPDFDRVMQAAGQPDADVAGRSRAARRMAGRISPMSRRRSKPRAMRRSLRSTACASCNTAMAISSACFARCVTPRARWKRSIRCRQDCRR